MPSPKEYLIPEIQKAINQENLYWKEISERFGVATTALSSWKKEGKLIFKTREEMRRLRPRTLKPVSEESRKRMSESRKAYYKKHPDKIIYRLQHSSFGESYPEKYFREWLEMENIPFKKEVEVSLYRLDFVIGNIDLEIDGDQHYYNPKIVKSDIERTEFLKTLGIETIRIRWGSFKKLSHEEKATFLKNLKNRIDSTNSISENEALNILLEQSLNKKDKHICPRCSKKKSAVALNCMGCCMKKGASRDKRDHSHLIEEIKTSSYEELGRRYGVSGNMIKKRLLRLGHKKPKPSKPEKKPKEVLFIPEEKLMEAYNATNENVCKTAIRLGISRGQARKRLRKLGLCK